MTAAGHLAPLLCAGAAGAAKLDILFRGIALLPVHTGERVEVGLVLPKYTYDSHAG